MMRNKRVEIRYSQAELEVVKQRAADLNVRLATFARLASLDAIPAAIPPANGQLIVELSRIGSNLNQIARFANASGGFDLDRRALKNEMAALRMALTVVPEK